MNSKKHEINTEINKLKQMANELECLKNELKVATSASILDVDKIKQMNESCFEINNNLQVGIEKVYDSINNLAKTNNGCDYNTENSLKRIYSKDWVCGGKSDSGKTENKIAKLEKFRDEVFL